MSILHSGVVNQEVDGLVELVQPVHQQLAAGRGGQVRADRHDPGKERTHLLQRVFRPPADDDAMPALAV